MNLDDINRILDILVGGVKLYLTTGHNGNEFYFMYCEDTDKNIHALKSLDMDYLIKKAWEAKRVSWIKMNGVCNDAVGNIVYIDKEIPVVVDRINICSQGIKIVTIEGETYDSDNLWIRS